MAVSVLVYISRTTEGLFLYLQCTVFVCDSVLNKECGNKSMKRLNFGFECVSTLQIICLTATFNTCIKV